MKNIVKFIPVTDIDSCLDRETRRLRHELRDAKDMNMLLGFIIIVMAIGFCLLA